jgi:hypothetical protein
VPTDLFVLVGLPPLPPFSLRGLFPAGSLP